MPKQKTKKIITKRFRITKTGKVLRRQAFRRHLNTKKSRSTKRRLKRIILTEKTHAKKIKKIMGVGN
jgi:large subunit ribosomal protein L35